MRVHVHVRVRLRECAAMQDMQVDWAGSRGGC